jgi:hypothetical protein
MMAYVDRTARDIASMPWGGPDASWLDRRLQTNRLEYLDRDDVDDLKRRVVCSLNREGRLLGHHKKFARTAVGEVQLVAGAVLAHESAWVGRYQVALSSTASATGR